MESIELFWDKNLEGGGTKYGIPSLQSPNISPYINDGSILDLCSGVGTLGFYIYTQVKCSNLTLVDINPSVESYINNTIKHNKLTNVEFILSNGLDNIPLDKKFDTVVLNPPHFKDLTLQSNQTNRIAVDSINLDFHNNFYKNIYKYLKPTSSIIHIGCYTGDDAITPIDIINITKDTYNIHFIEYNSTPTNLIQVREFKEIPSKFYTMVLKPNPNL